MQNTVHRGICACSLGESGEVALSAVAIRICYRNRTQQGREELRVNLHEEVRELRCVNQRII